MQLCVQCILAATACPLSSSLPAGHCQVFCQAVPADAHPSVWYTQIETAKSAKFAVTWARSNNATRCA
eukprot:2544780-Amphidinium_carterae.3